MKVIFTLLLTFMVACAHGIKPQFPHTLILQSASDGRFSFAHCRGKVTIVDFFTTWSQTSVVCVAGYSALYRKYSDQGLCVIGVALDKLTEAVEPYCKGMQIEYPVVFADNRIRNGQSIFGSISIIPMMMVFDRQGFLLYKIAGYIPVDKLEKNLVPLLR